MTRINCGIDPKLLTRQHIIAESREIKRIPNTIVSGKAIVKDIPPQFTLGTGHVRFFYNKLGYLLSRYRQVRDECKARGYNITDYESAWNGVPSELMNDYTPTDRDRKIVIERLISKDRYYSRYVV